MPAERVVLITGAGRGIGAACAVAAARQGYAVALNFLRNDVAVTEVAHAVAALGGTAFPVRADVAVEAEVVAMFAQIHARFGRLDGLVNNAGILSRQMRVEDMDAERINRIFATNVTGSFLCAREAVRRMSTQHGGQGGAIVNVSSRAPVPGSPGE